MDIANSSAPVSVLSSRTCFLRKTVEAAALLLALAGFKQRANADNTYHFTRIDNTNFITVQYLGRSAASLNEQGSVAFGGLDTQGRHGLFTGDGTEQALSDYRLIVAEQPGTEIHGPGSYVGSRVAFCLITNQQTGTGGFFSSDGFSLRTIITDPTIRNLSDGLVLMNHAGQTAYLGGTTAGDVGIYVAQNGSSKPIYTIPESFTHGTVVEMHNVGNLRENTQINDSGDIYFQGDFFNLPVDPMDTQIDFGGLVWGNLGGDLPKLLVTDGQLSNGDFQSLDEIAGNNAGQVACVVSISDNVGLYYRLLKASGGAATTLTDTRSGPFLSFGSGSERTVAINDAGTIIFMAQFHDGNGVTQTGLFTGPDPVNDKVIATGDSLFGSTVGNITFDRVGFNNAGQVAFAVTLNSKTAIVRAEPIDGSSEVDWVGGGTQPDAFGEPDNWHPVNGDPARVPTKTDVISDTAKFQDCTSVPVNVGQQQFERLVINCGDVTFNQGDVTLAALSETEPSLEIIRGSLTLDATTLKSSHAAIGSGLTGKMVVLVGSSWQNQGRVEVGKNGDGLLEIHDIVQHAESRIGTGSGQGAVLADGPAAFWTTGNLAVGFDGLGSLTLTNGAEVFSDFAVLGLESGSKGTVSLNGPLINDGSGHYPRWIVSGNDGLVVGGSGEGRLFMYNQSGLVVTNAAHSAVLTIGDHTSGNGLLRMFSDPADPNLNSSPIPGLVADSIFVGQSGPGELSVESGIVIVRSGLIIGYNANGGVNLNGANGAFTNRLALLSASFVSVGDHATPGTLELRNGASVVCGNATMGQNASAGWASATISDPDSQWTVETNLDVGASGESIIQLENGGTLEVDGTLFLRSDSTLKGSHQGGTVKAHIEQDGGTISPGFPPGMLSVEGQLDQLPGGRLLIEIGGTNAADYDHLVVNGTANLNGTLELRFINGFAPKQGDTFDFLQLGGTVNNSFANVELKNLAPGFQFDVKSNGTALTLEALNDGVFVTPLQGQISTGDLVTIGGISYLPYTLQVTDDCSIVEPSGPVTRLGNDLYLKLGERSDSGCAGISANVSRTLPLGALEPGGYQFHFMSAGVEVYSVGLAVPMTTDQVLTYARTGGGELNLQINGKDNVQYTVQQTGDLVNWSDLSTHVGTFLGPYSIFEPMSASPSRFYRVKIEEGQ